MIPPPVNVLTVYFCALSLIAAAVTVSDKIKAKNHEWRVPENTLILIAALGGSAAMYLTMLLIRHKTRHIKFMLGIPMIMVCQAILLIWADRHFGLF